jgi:hypothetical protein
MGTPRFAFPSLFIESFAFDPLATLGPASIPSSILRAWLVANLMIGVVRSSVPVVLPFFRHFWTAPVDSERDDVSRDRDGAV